MSKKMIDSATLLAQWALPEDTNPYGTVHGGVIMKMIDNAAAVAAMRHYGDKSVTSGVHDLSLKSPVQVGDVLEAKAFVAYTYGNRMIVEVIVSKENPSTRETTQVSAATLTFVGLRKTENNEKYVSAPKIIAEDEEEKQRYSRGEKFYREKFEARFEKINELKTK